MNSIPRSWRELFSKDEIFGMSYRVEEILNELEDCTDLPEEWAPCDDEKGYLASWLIQAFERGMLSLGELNILRNECHLETEIPKIHSVG